MDDSLPIQEYYWNTEIQQCSEPVEQQKPGRIKALAAVTGSKVVLMKNSTEGFLCVQQLYQIVEARHLPIQDNSTLYELHWLV